MKNNDFGTVNRIDFSAKPGTKFIKYHGDNQKTSFAIGFQGSPFNSYTPSGNHLQLSDRSRITSDLRVGSDLSSSSFASKGTAKMLKEHFSLGRSNGEFKTINQVCYRWIQPRGDRYS